MSSTGSVPCTKLDGALSCTKNEDGTCKFNIVCTIITPEEEFPCECVCICHISTGDCKKCVCKCDCTTEKAQRIKNTDGTVKYFCECSCSC